LKEKTHVCIENQERIQKILRTGAEFLGVPFADIIIIKEILEHFCPKIKALEERLF